MRDVRIVDNRIEDMGQSGITVDRFFDMETNPDFITVEDLVIEQNRITGCMRLEVGTLPFNLRDVIGFGGRGSGGRRIPRDPRKPDRE